MPGLPTNITPKLMPRSGKKILVPFRVRVGSAWHEGWGMYDTGATPTATFDEAFAKKIGLKATGNVRMANFGGAVSVYQTGWIDGLEIPGANCAVGREQVAIGKVPPSDGNVIIGIAFHEDTSATVEGKKVYCKGGVPTGGAGPRFSTPEKATLIVIAGAVALTVGYLAFTK